MSAPTLRPYQLETLHAIVAELEKGNRRLLVKAPTGTGKTVTFAAMLQYRPLAERLLAWKPRGASMLVIAHREELLEQAAEKIQRANPGLLVAIEQGDRYAARTADVVIASIQTLAALKFRRLARLLELHGHFPLVIVDEAHHAAASTYRTALVHLGFLPPADATDRDNVESATFDDVAEMERALAGWDQVGPTDRLLVGFTATPNRSDAVGLSCVFQTIAYSLELKTAIKDKHLVPIEAWVVETQTSLDEVRTTAGDFNQKDLAAAVNTELRNLQGLAAWREHAYGLPTIAFTVDVAHAHTVASMFRTDGIRAAAISGETPREERRLLLRQFMNRQLEVLANCMVLTEGTDLPLASCILHLKPTKSATLYEQMTGRGLRPAPGKDRCVVIDLADLARRHSLQTSPSLLGLPTGYLVNGKDLEEAEQELETLREQFPAVDFEAMLAQGRLTLEQLRARAEKFDVWKVPDLGELRQVVTMNWIKTGTDRYRLQYPFDQGTETLQVEPDLLGKFSLVSTYRELDPQTHHTVAVRQRTLAQDFEGAAGALVFAETWVSGHRRQIVRLKGSEAPWRAGPASPKQIAMLQRLRIPFNPKTITKGGASDLIDLARARQGR